MTDTAPADLRSIDRRIGSARIQLSGDGSSYTAQRVFGAPPARVYHYRRVRERRDTHTPRDCNVDFS